MTSAKLTSVRLEQAVELSRQRDALREELDAVDTALAAGRPRGGKSLRGALKQTILTALRLAGREGLTVQGLARLLAMPVGNIHVWFSTTGKKIKAIERLGGGRYRVRSRG